MRAELAPLTTDRLTVDAVQPTDDNFHRVLSYVAVE
jgi:hypothetical protein